MKLLALLICLLIVPRNDCAKILGVFTAPSKSHVILAFELFRELVKSGHEVTVITPVGCEMKNPPKNYTSIIVGEELVDVFKAKLETFFDEVDDNPAFKINDMISMTVTLAKSTILNPQVQALLKPEVKFDLVISEIMMNEAVFGFSEFFNCPHILISTVGATPWVDIITNNPSPLSYVPSQFLDLTDKMSLVGRLQNTMYYFVEQMMTQMLHYPKQKQIYETAFPNAKSFRPFWEKMKHGISLVLVNGDFSISFPRPYLPNLIEVAGMHIKKAPSPLPKDLKDFIDGAQHGVVYFSLGSNLLPSSMPIEKQQAIINALSKLKEKIIWKWDDENAKVDRSKFLVRKWFPQDDILAEANVKLFVTHGGLLSGTESIYHGKPLVVIPIFGDQKMNAARTVANGYGVRVDYNNLTESSFTWALQEILLNENYTTRAKELSCRFKDKPQHPVDRATFYVEYVLRHKGAPFMQSSSTFLNFIEFHNLDVLGIIAIICAILSYAIIFAVKSIFKFISLRTQKKFKKN